MSDTRFDVRTKDQFITAIKHSTDIEGFVFRWWASVSQKPVTSWGNNGCDNTGEFLPTGTNTSGADFKVSIAGSGVHDLPLEVKLVPLYGFMTLKARDLAAYAREGAGILFIVPARPDADIRMSRGLSLDDRKALLRATPLEWGIMWPKTVAKVAAMPMKPQACFGGKPGVRLFRDEFARLFTLFPLEAYDEAVSDS